MLVVLDTNVFVSACLGQGASAAIVAACLHGRLTALMAAASLAVYGDVLARGGSNELTFPGLRFLTPAQLLNGLKPQEQP